MWKSIERVKSSIKLEENMKDIDKRHLEKSGIADHIQREKSKHYNLWDEYR